MENSRIKFYFTGVARTSDCVVVGDSGGGRLEGKADQSCFSFFFRLIPIFHPNMSFNFSQLPYLWASQEFCPKAQLAATKYLTFLQKLSKSNKIGFRAFSLDIITECMGEEWIWSIPLKIMESASRKCVKSTHPRTKFFARSLLSLVRIVFPLSTQHFLNDMILSDCIICTCTCT